jgi:hypothetical protein
MIRHHQLILHGHDSISDACTADTLDTNFQDHDMVRFLIYEASAFSLNTLPKEFFLQIATSQSRERGPWGQGTIDRVLSLASQSL